MEEDMSLSKKIFDNYRLFFIVALSAIILIYIYDLGLVGLTDTMKVEIVTKYPFIANNDILINMLGFFYNLSENNIIGTIIFLCASALFITGSFLLIFIVFSAVIYILVGFVNNILINIILFCMLNAYLMYYPLHVMSQGCAAPILFADFFKLIFFFIIVIALWCVIGLVESIINKFKKV